MKLIDLARHKSSVVIVCHGTMGYINTVYHWNHNGQWDLQLINLGMINSEM